MIRLRRALALAFIIGGMCVLGGRSAQADTVEEKAAVCSACHGAAGIPVSAETPVIWGQQEGYLYLQLRDFKKGARANDIMSQVAGSLDRDDMLELAHHFAAKPWPGLGQPSASDADTAAAKTANASVGCSGCHLAQFQGTGTSPRLAGQSRDYLDKTLAEFRSNARANNPGMTSLAKAASEAELAAMEAYLAGL